MKYIVIPAEILIDIPQEELDILGLSPRYSVDKSEVIMKLDNYNKLFPPTMEVSEDNMDTKYPYPIYISGSHEFNDLIESSNWNGEVI